MNKYALSKHDLLAQLFEPSTIRERSQLILDLVTQNKSSYFQIDFDKLQNTASFVIEVIRERYPNLDVPYHSRWRHFELDGQDKTETLKLEISQYSTEEQGIIFYELAIISVLLDAGAGQDWKYIEPHTGKELSRSEGLAIASLNLYTQGFFSADPNHFFRVDADRLLEISEEDLKHAFQVTALNPLAGISGRQKLLNRLGEVIKNKPNFFNQDTRLGNFYLYIHSLINHQTIKAEDIFKAVLAAFNSIWPPRLVYEGMSLGDVWTHPLLSAQYPNFNYIPFHKLSQWLSYSLIEPLEWGHIQVTNMEALTGLPEYRNGGLLIDTGLLIVKDPDLLQHPQAVDSEAIIEWRALTVALLDRISQCIRNILNKSSNELPLGKILQGGTWEAGRRIAQVKRPNGIPPIQIISDGTIF